MLKTFTVLPNLRIIRHVYDIGKMSTISIPSLSNVLNKEVMSHLPSRPEVCARESKV